MIGLFLGMPDDYEKNPNSDNPHIRYTKKCTLTRYKINVLIGIDMCSGTFYNNI